MHKLSIIVPALNEAELLDSTLQPLQPLREQGVEVILVDGGSADGTPQQAQSLVDMVWLSDPGRARQMNAGAMIASGDYLLFLHADTQLPKDFEKCWQRIQQYQPLWGFFPVRLSGSRQVLKLVSFFMNLRSRLTSIATGDQCIYVQRQLFDELGGYGDIPLMEDVEFTSRLRQRKRARLVASPVTTSSRRWERDGVWRTIWLMWRLRWRYFCGADPQQLVKQYY
ncbi:TIGR04283 family arsenosugar biosynthesis glycosyltransferase [Porticoccus sp. W117]|uniref:TIGR04283 family arsenosugar biosynthesis glycosyltransferase n=1 Tax=Porticoccus sp. W117 TaxID=3054777 RepID=UPI002597D3A4|nr:TIGR04283 family arsenosugar biosynthesis glycosyltransferase [Porticoccus sp. W117]MDM3869786.1 TIGR04283 family arsenosugar biosynthesis glycosyltransferase [Porticoccus sp. W117]